MNTNNESSNAAKTAMHYTEPSIRVVTVFFAALVGFGLKHLADGTEEDTPGIHPHHFTCFVLAALLFLRFLLGSANHLWHEHSRRRPDVETFHLGRDLATLICIGLFAMRICYTENLTQFLWWSVVLLSVACIWSMIDWFYDSNKGKWLNKWFIINILQVLALVIVALWMVKFPVLCFGFAWWEVFLFAVYVVCLGFDFAHQIHVLKRG